MARRRRDRRSPLEDEPAPHGARRGSDTSWSSGPESQPLPDVPLARSHRRAVTGLRRTAHVLSSDAVSYSREVREHARRRRVERSGRSDALGDGDAATAGGRVRASASCPPDLRGTRRHRTRRACEQPIVAPERHSSNPAKYGGPQQPMFVNDRIQAQISPRDPRSRGPRTGSRAWTPRTT